MSGKVGTKETEEVLDFLGGAVGDLAKAKSDDGKVSLLEWAKVGMSNAPAGIAAVRDIEKVADEVKDLDEGEARVLAAKGLELAQQLIALLGLK